uniref:Uncharacterized protein n=1 Tax=Photinus pyralis TaxID=7054 RepID=A0A1Y1MXH7_PHOPY
MSEILVTLYESELLQMIKMKTVLCVLVCWVLVEARPSKDTLGQTTTMLSVTPDNTNDVEVPVPYCFGYTCPKGTVTCAVDAELTDHWKKKVFRCMSKNHVLLDSFNKTTPICNGKLCNK